jgi:hypothetical protein
MLDIFLERLLNGYSLSLLVIAVFSFVAVVRLMRQALQNPEQANLSALEFSMEMFTRSIVEKKWSVPALIFSTGWLYSRLVERSRHDISWPSLALTFGQGVVMILGLVVAAVLAKWLSPRQIE